MPLARHDSRGAARVKGWFLGSNNLCIPIQVESTNPQSGRKLMFRVPLPYKFGQFANEKLRSEAATYVWMQDNCPDVPIPHLWGFGLTNGRKFTHPSSASFLPWIRQTIQRMYRISLGLTVPCRYIQSYFPTCFAYGYMLMDYLDKGQPLSSAWVEQPDDKPHREKLYRGLSRIMISMARIPMPRIGSFTMDDQGIITLTNRPLTRQVRDLESQGITSNIKRTYSAVSSYVHDILDDHNLCLSYTPNSIFSDEDGLSQMAALTVMRSIPRHFISREYDSGPFIMTLTDINPGNIFVDDKWNVTGIVDLEWTCSLPAEFIHPPHWMTGKTEANILIDAEFVQRHQEFKDLYEAEEASMHSTYRIGIPSLDKRTLFYCLALFHTVHLYQIFHCHIKPLYLDELNEDEEREGLCKFMAPFWGRDVANTINCKVAERESYILQVKEHFRTQLEEKRIRSG